MKAANVSWTWRVKASAVGILAALTLCTHPAPVASFCNQDTPGSILQCPGNRGGHKPITRQGLGFLRPTVYDDIVDENVFMDTVFGLTGSRHFDGCDFQGGSQFIRDQYANEVLVEFDPNDPEPFDATDEFGQLLHTAQDFYSHSNWVELGRSDLIDSSLVNWAVLNPFQAIRSDLVVAQGENLPTGWSIVTTGKTPTVNDNAMPPTTYKALISGAFGADDCEDTLTISHGSASSATDPGLNKDSGVRPGYVVAQSLAAQQTAHEWCRMLHLLQGQYGYPGPSIPLTLWVAPGRNPHLGGTACALGSPGPITVKVTVKSIKVLDDTDTFGPGEMNFVFMLYTGDFTRSTRSDVGMFSISSGSSLTAQQLPKMLSLCLKATETLVITLQGWDDDNTSSTYDGVYDDSDDTLKGVTLSVSGPGFSPGTHKLTSPHLEVEFEITVTP